MDVGTVLSVAQTLFSALQCSELNEVISIFGYKSQLEELQHTVKTINAVLRDADAKQELSHEAQNWVEELKDAVFEADDMFDEFVTLAEHKQLLKADGSLSKKVSNFFSRSKNPLSVAYRMSRGIKDIKKKLNAIAYNSLFSFKLDVEPTRKRRPETCSYVNEVDIIGREDDLEGIVGRLLDSNVQCDVSFLSVVGIGGLGKTALAQLVYNDPRVMSAFPLRMWTCVSDQDQKQLDLKEILLKILDKNPDGITMDKVHRQLREKLAGKKYLLVLDDVWTENHDQWRALAGLLIGGQRGSWIVVTTRSQETSRIIGDGLMHKLQGLSQENSWLLFKRTAFGSEHSSPPDDLVKMGQAIISRCAGVPLAIRVVGSLLYGQDESKWVLFQEINIANIRESQNDIMPILKLSYHHLESPLKSCFSFCALFPKDFVIKKRMLISIWMAQGYILPLDEGQSLEDAGDEYFSILSRRCFFQDIKEDGKGEISCKIHDLMHDIAQKVSGKEICSTNTFNGNLDKKIRHLFLHKDKQAQYSLQKSQVRSIFLYDTYMEEANEVLVKTSIANCMRLRALHLKNLRIRSLPESIGQLLHLRYIDLSWNPEIFLLPKSFTKLCNLQTLELNGCSSLRELPKDFRKLVKLRALDIDGCPMLKYMPRGMDKLSCLQRLSNFIVGGEGSCSSWKQWCYGLDELKALNKLKGCLNIKIIWPNDVDIVDKEDLGREGSYLRSKKELNHIVFGFGHEEPGGRMDDDKTMKLMEELQPHSNLQRLEVREYQGAKMPGWVASLANLVNLHIKNCQELKYLSQLGNLRHLKELKLENLAKLEYIEEDNPWTNSKFTLRSGLVAAEELQFFPALESLSLNRLPKLEGWRRGVGVDNINNKAQLQIPLFGFPQLKSLSINACPQLKCIPMCPKVESLWLYDFNARLQIANTERLLEEVGETPSSSVSRDPENSSSSSSSLPVPKLKRVNVSNAAWLSSLPIESFQCLDSLIISMDKVESLQEVEKVFHSCSSSLRFLGFAVCSNLSSVVSGGLEHLTALEHLAIAHCPNLRLLEEEDARSDGIATGILPWKSLHHSLQTLRLCNLPQLEYLPNGMQYLTNLHTIELRKCERLESLPNWMPKLTSLRMLNLLECSEGLMRRCQEDPPGEDWPYIQQIPLLIV